MNSVKILNNAVIVYQNSTILAVEHEAQILENGVLRSSFAERLGIRVDKCEYIDAGGNVVVPGFVDSHTHIVFGGFRYNEFEMRASGATYQEIAASGSGILSTMRATREAGFSELYEVSRKRLHESLHHGTTTIEIKSGYGLSIDHELMMLRVIRELQHTEPTTIIPTFLGAHAYPPEFRDDHERYLRLICEVMIPSVAQQNLAQFCDIFCEQNYFSLDDTRRVMQCARENGLGIKLHADQLSSSGASELGVQLGALSVDHLEQSSGQAVVCIAHSPTIATVLPGASLFLRHQYAPARQLIDAGAALAIATDCNPGSSMTFSMPMMMTLACTQMSLTPAEALTACTLNGAAALGLEKERGTLEPGKKADILLLNIPDYRYIAYHFATNHIIHVIKDGKVVV